MIPKSLKIISVCAILLYAMAGIEVFSQIPQNTPIKRNSPFSPNPKKKADSPTETTSNPAKDEKKVDQADSAKTQPTEPDNSSNGTSNEGDTKSELITEPKTEPTTSTTNPDGENTEFESRSVARKTLEVAKRANPVTVSPTDIYKIGAGDILLISLQNAPSKETSYFTVLKDGTIDYPLAGEMLQILGLTTDQIEDLLKEKIKLYENPQVSVKVREHNSHSFTVLGLVERSGEKQMQREAIPLYVVRAEAVVQSRANQVLIKREGQPIQSIDLRDVKSGEILIYPNDIVEFGVSSTIANAGQTSQFYFIGGEISSGGRKDFVQGLTLTQAILESGGLKKSNVKKIVIRRKNEAGLLVSSEYDLKLIKDGKAIDPEILPGDTIEIGN